MTLAKQIRIQINKWPIGKTFGYADLDISKKEYVTAAKALERMQEEGLIKKYPKVFFTSPNKPSLVNCSRIIVNSYVLIYLRMENEWHMKLALRCTTVWD